TRIVSKLVLALLMTFFGSVTALAQATDGNIVGTVFDPTGAVVGGASLELENVATGLKFESSTNADGQYRFNNILVGSYKITARATGFKAAVLENLRVELNKTTTTNITLQVGEVSTAVEVSEAAETIDTTTAQITSTYDTKVVEYMPTIENSVNGLFGVLNLSLLGSGVASNGGVGQGEDPSIRLG